MPQLPPTHPSQPEEVLPPFDIATVPETDDDAIPAQEVLPRAQAPAGVDASNLPIPRVVLGCATFGYGVYDEMDNLRSTMPVRVVRAALRAGMNAFDTGESKTSYSLPRWTRWPRWPRWPRWLARWRDGAMEQCPPTWLA
jgi:hypothetical protein